MALKVFSFKNNGKAFVTERNFSVIAKTYQEAENRVRALKIDSFQLIDVVDYEDEKDFIKRGKTEYMPQNGHYLDYAKTVVHSYKG